MALDINHLLVAKFRHLHVYLLVLHLVPRAFFFSPTCEFITYQFPDCVFGLFSSVTFFIIDKISMCVCVLGAGTHVNRWMWRPEVPTGASSITLHLTFEQGLSLHLDLTDSVRLAAGKIPGSSVLTFTD